MAHFVVFIAKKSTRFRVMVREYSSTKFATRGSPNIYCHIYRKWLLLVDSKCRNTVILTGLTYTLSRKVLLNNKQQ